MKMRCRRRFLVRESWRKRPLRLRCTVENVSARNLRLALFGDDK